MNFKRDTTVLRFCLLLAVLVSLLGCGGVRTVGEQSRANAFDAAVKTYTKLIRWGYFEEASAYIRAPDDSQINTDLARIARYRVTAYDNINQLTADNDREGRVLAMIEYYEIDSGVVQQVRDEQLWWFDDETKRWFLSSGMPKFGFRNP